jgi:radical SAM protein with 4Fe4S-binding SPASM domain
MQIAPDGLVTLCEQMPQTKEHTIGDVRKQTIMEIWNSDRLLHYIYPDEDRFKGTACFDCGHFEECHRASGHCFRDALFFHGSRYMPVNCPLAAKPLRQS